MSKRYQTPMGRAIARRTEQERAQEQVKASGVLEIVRRNREKSEQESKERKSK